VVALTYNGGVAIVSDTKVSYGSTSRYFHNERQLVLNRYCIVAYSGDCADFQWLQNYIQTEQEDFRSRMGDQNAYLKPKMVHSFLTSYLYYRRSKMDPLWNTLVVIGMF
jgi:20S proteasome subunit beta 7